MVLQAIFLEEMLMESNLYEFPYKITLEISAFKLIIPVLVSKLTIAMTVVSGSQKGCLNVHSQRVTTLWYVILISIFSNTIQVYNLNDTI